MKGYKMENKRVSRKMVTDLAESLKLNFIHSKGYFYVFRDLSTAGKNKAKVLFRSKLLKNILAFLLELKKDKEAKARVVFIKENLQKRNIALSKGQSIEMPLQPSFCF